MKATHRRIKVTYNFEKKINQKVNLGRRPTHDARHQTPARSDIAILNDGCFEKPVQKYSGVQSSQGQITKDEWQIL